MNRKAIAVILICAMLVAIIGCDRGKDTETVVPTLAPVPQQTTAPTSETVVLPTIAPTTPSPEPVVVSASEKFEAFDNEFFREYMGFMDHMSQHQLVVDLDAMGIEAAPISLGSPIDPEGDAEWNAWVLEMQEKLYSFNRSELTSEQQIVYDTVEIELALEIEGAQFTYNYEPIAPYVGTHADLPISFWLYEINDLEDLENYLTLLEDVPRYFDELIDYEKVRAEQKLFMTESALESVLEDIDDVTADGDEFFLYDTFQETLAGFTDMSEADKAAYTERNNAAVTAMLEAYGDLADGLSALESYCSEVVPISERDNNEKDYFNYMLKVRSGNSEMDAEAAIALLADAVDDAFWSYYRNMLSWYSSSASSTDPNITFGSSEADLEYLEEFYKDYLPTLGEHEVTLHQVPSALADVFSPAAYLTPAFDDWTNNVVLMNVSDDDTDVLFTMAHEAYPGHMYQSQYHRQLGVSLTQQLLENSAYAEAWSQFAEYLVASECDAFPNDYMLYNQSWDQFFTLIETYLSVLVHVEGIDYQEFCSEISNWINWVSGDDWNEFTESFYNRIYDMPYYTMYYAFGYAQFFEMYNAAEHSLGEKFDQKAYLTAYLDIGPTYFNLMEDILDDWVKEQNSSTGV